MTAWLTGYSPIWRTGLMVTLRLCAIGALLLALFASGAHSAGPPF